MSDNLACDVSVAIVSYNNAEQIRICIHSVARDLADYSAQIVIVDNASTDGTVALVESAIAEISHNSPRLVLIENSRNVGFTKGLNQALSRCTGANILILNPDTELLMPCVPALLQCLNGSSRIGIVAPQLLNRDGTIQRSCRRFPRRTDLLFEVCGLSYLLQNSSRFNRWKMGGFDHNTALTVDQPQGAFLLFRSSLLAEVGPWDEQFPMFFSDVDWCYRVKNRGYQIVFEPAARARHDKGASIYQNRIKMIWTSHRSFYRYFRKYKSNILLGNHFLGFILLVAAGLRILILLIGRLLTFARG